ncbi:MAG: DUF4212 domain-containing protein [Phycisphaerae bacterium]|jgi:putative solute:sodium symporter small subunit|nr:DUF4212 domain-containing protein [Phycisphaerae bacterium]
MSHWKDRASRKYWRSNLRVLLLLLSIWFVVSFVLSIFLVELLNKVHIAGFPLGFWFAQQGSIYVFIVLIYVYARWMQKLDREYEMHEKEQEQEEDKS